jgi:hypothetical protein
MKVDKAVDLITGLDRPRDTPYLHRAISVPRGKKTINILPIGCIQAGVPIHDKELNALIKWTENRDDTYVILMGDLMELRRTGHRLYQQIMTPSAQIRFIKDKFEKLGKQKKILAYVPGNHENRTIYDWDLNPAHEIAMFLGAKYMEWSGFIELVVGKKYRYIVYITHGWGGSRTKGARINKMQSLVWNDADIYCLAHDHDSMIDTRMMRYVKDGGIQTRKQYFCMTGTWMQYEGTYADERQFPLGKLGTPRIILSGDKWDVHASV